MSIHSVRIGRGECWISNPFICAKTGAGRFRIEQFVEWTRSVRRRVPTETVGTRWTKCKFGDMEVWRCLGFVFHTSTPPYLHTLIRHGHALVPARVYIHRQYPHSPPAGFTRQRIGSEEA